MTRRPNGTPDSVSCAVAVPVHHSPFTTHHSPFTIHEPPIHRPDCILPPQRTMRLPHSSLSAAGAAAAAALLVRHELKGRQAAERIAAAALESLLKAIDANDPDTGAHVRRVASYALVLADAAGLSDHEKRTVER